MSWLWRWCPCIRHRKSYVRYRRQKITVNQVPPSISSPVGIAVAAGTYACVVFIILRAKNDKLPS